jgi:hypothetical protein
LLLYSPGESTRGFHTRFNLALLRKYGFSIVPGPQYGAVSRRAFLGISGAGLAAAAAPSPEEFSIVRAGRAVHVSTGGAVRWSIDPADFGPRAHAGFLRSANRVDIELSEAFFPGTRLTGDFHCTAMRSSGAWTMALRWASGLLVEADGLTG